MKRRLSGPWMVIGYVSESSSFCLFIKTDGKSWSFRLRGRKIRLWLALRVHYKSPHQTHGVA
jgi:hypothetical protein